MTEGAYKLFLLAVSERMREIGKPSNYAFGQGDASWAFLEAGFWMVSRDDVPHSMLVKQGSPVTYYVWPHELK